MPTKFLAKIAISLILANHLRCVTNQEIYKFSIATHCWSAGHNFSFHQAKIIFKPNRISELDFLENIAIHLSREIIANGKIHSIMVSTALKKLIQC